MAEYILFALGIVLFGLTFVPDSDTLFIDGCPMYGCRPSGAFSFYMDVPRDDPTLNWRSRGFDPVPKALGCVADSVNIVCQSNGVFSNDKGYMVLNGENGTVQWRDGDLTFPTLPILDNYGDVTGSDGDNLVHYDADGTKYPVIPCKGLKPIFSITLVGSSVLLLVSKRGDIVVRETNGVPIGYLYLTAKVGNTTGTFLPIAQPVVDEQRLYVLTEFVPSDSSKQTGYTVNRIYAIDVHATISDRISVAWYYDLGYSLRRVRDHEDHGNDQRLLWDSGNKYVYVNLPFSVSKLHPDIVVPTVVAVKDGGKSGSIVFKSAMNVTHMARFKPDHCEVGNVCSQDFPKPLVWLARNDSTLLSVNSDGTINQTIDVTSFFNSPVNLLTKVAVAKKDDSNSDNLIFGLEVLTSDPTTYLIAIGANDTPRPLWTVPVPGNPTLKGQIVVSAGSDADVKDQLIVYAEDRAGNSASILSFH